MITIKKEILQQLLDNFYSVCNIADECNVYEYPSLDNSMQEMEEWVNDTFGRKITKENFE